MNANYWRARGYAFKLDPVNYRDIVHDAFLTWHKKTGENLFEQHPQVITQVVKNVYGAKVGKKYFNWEKKRYLKQFLTDTQLQAPTLNSKGTDLTYFKTTETPEDIFIHKELEEQLTNFKNLLSEENKVIYEGFKNGVSAREIAVHSKYTGMTISNRIKKMKASIDKVLNNE